MHQRILQQSAVLAKRVMCPQDERNTGLSVCIMSAKIELPLPHLNILSCLQPACIVYAYEILIEVLLVAATLGCRLSVV